MATAIVRFPDLARCLVIVAGLLLMVPSGVGTSFALVGTALESSDAAAADGWTFDYDASGVVYDAVSNVRGAAVDGAVRSHVRARPIRATLGASVASPGVISAPRPAPGTYVPDRPLPRTPHGDPIPDVIDAPHTQLGTRGSGPNAYGQARQWEFDPDTGNLVPTRDIDFTDHGFPAGHPNPHQHSLTPNSPAVAPRGGMIRGGPEPFIWGWLRWPWS